MTTEMHERTRRMMRELTGYEIEEHMNRARDERSAAIREAVAACVRWVKRTLASFESGDGLRASLRDAEALTKTPPAG